MREIKFRAWERSRKRMLIVMTLVRKEQAPFCLCREKTEGTSEAISTYTLDLMEYTGLKDKNGKKIYEGDIVVASWHWTKPHVIVWPDDYYSIIEFAIKDEITILGNIYENPELLEEEK